jgi:hypothetical protein
VKDLDHVTEDDRDWHELNATRRVAAAPRRLDEEVQQHVFPIGGSDKHVATGAQTREQRLADEGRAHRGEGGVNRVAARTQRAGARFGGQRMPSGHDSPRHRRSVTERFRGWTTGAALNRGDEVRGLDVRGAARAGTPALSGR